MAKVKETIHDDEELISFYQEQVIRVVRKCKKVRWLSQQKRPTEHRRTFENL